MKVKILVEFEVTAGAEVTGSVAKSAASMAAWDNLCLTRNGIGVHDSVTVHVDGYGECEVKIGEEHE